LPPEGIQIISLDGPNAKRAPTSYDVAEGSWTTSGVEMKVFYDAQTFMRQRSGGISRLFTDLISEFDGHPEFGVEASLSFSWSNNIHAASRLADRGLRAAPNWVPRAALYGSSWLTGASAPVGVDIVHHTYYSERFLRGDRGPRRVSTVHDMIPELFAGTEGFTASHLEKSRYVAESDLVICVSESTKADMLTHFGSIPGQIRVIPNAVRADFGPDGDSIPGLPSEYLLYVGARGGYKDFTLLPQAMQLLRGDGTAIPLVVVGKTLTADEVRLLDECGVQDQVIQVQMKDEELKRAYANCTVLVQTSCYEGFGLTPLEGMASGVPVVIASAASMPEVGGSVARYFEPGDAADLASSIAALLADDALRAELGALGIERAGQFTVSAMAQATAEAYKSILP
jgi:glycosyltransferase involved in cell wall biosynthesis